MADPPPCPDTGGTSDDTGGTSDDTGAPGRGAAAGRPRWMVALFWAVAIAVLLTVLTLHLTGTLGAGTNG